MMNVAGDKLTMLLSTDWFFDYWQIIGLPVPGETRKLIQRACRREVERLLEGAEVYWYALFSEERISETCSRLRDVFRDDSASSSVIASLLEAGDASSDSTANNSSSLLASLTQLLVSDPDSGTGMVGAECQQRVKRVWDACETIDIDFHALCAKSQTEWDKYIRSLTPDLPIMLADFLAVEITSRDRFAAFWFLLVKDISPAEKAALINWYETTATMLTDRPFEIPDWMKPA